LATRGENYLIIKVRADPEFFKQAPLRKQYIRPHSNEYLCADAVGRKQQRLCPRSGTGTLRKQSLCFLKGACIMNSWTLSYQWKSILAEWQIYVKHT